MNAPTARSSLALLAAALLAAGCGESAPEVPLDVDDPSALVAFRGITADPLTEEPRTYVAVASHAGSELKFIDVADDRPVFGQTLVFPLTVPTDPTPVRLAAAPLGDGGADLLVAGFTGIDIDPDGGSSGTPVLRLVNTWTERNRSLEDIPVPGLPPDAQLVSMIAYRAPGSPGRARLVAGYASGAGARLVVLDFVRGPAPEKAPNGVALGSVVLDAATAALPPKPIAFDPLDLALSPDLIDPAVPADLTGGPAIFVATTDPIGGVLGVARLTPGEPAAEWPVAALDAGVGTTQVAATLVREATAADLVTLVGPPALKVYAALDPATCGAGAAIRCGIATLDAATGALARDPLDGVSPRLPIEIPGVVADLVAAPVLTVRTGIGERNTSGVAAVPSTDGRVYLLDLARWSSAIETSAIAGNSRTRVTGASFQGGPSTSTPAGVTLEGDVRQPDGTTVRGPLTRRQDLPTAIGVTPGFTPTDTWRLELRGILPGLLNVPGTLFRALDGTVRVAAQGTVGGVTYTRLNLAAPSLGIAPADLVEVIPDTLGRGCPAATVLSSVTTVEAPGAEFPGGALVLPGAGLECVGAEPVPVAFTVRASGLVLVGAETGLAGRPVPNQPFAASLPRLGYVAEACGAADPACGFPGFQPTTTGAAIAFTPVVAEGADNFAGVVFTTQSGLAPAFRVPDNGSIPVAAAGAVVDATTFRIYVAYADDLVFVLDPAQDRGAVREIR